MSIDDARELLQICNADDNVGLDKNSSANSSSESLKNPGRISKWAPSIEDFAILKPISRGAFGKVFLARRK